MAGGIVVILLSVIVIFVQELIGPTNTMPVAPPQPGQPVLVPAALPAIPPDVSYKVITTDEIPGNGLRLQIRINKIVSKDVLRAIAMTLKATESRSYDRTFMFYYLPDMTLNGAWATTHFDPDLDVQILGFTAEQATALSVPAPSNQDTIGRWLDNEPYASSQITIYRANGKLLMDRKFYDGSSGQFTLVEKQSPLGRRFEDVDRSDTGDYFLITPDGDLQIGDNTGVVATATPVK